MTNVKLVIVLAALSACGPANERPPVQGRDAAAGVDSGGLPDVADAATDAALPDAPDAGAVLTARVDALSIAVSDARGAWSGRVEQTCEFRNGLPYFTAVFDSPAGNPCARVGFVGGELGVYYTLPDGGVDRWSAGWSCGKRSSSSVSSGYVVSSAPYVTVGDGGSVSRVNSQMSVALRSDIAGPLERVTVTILGCPVRPSP